MQSSRGPLKVKLGLNQASKKKSRRIQRAARAAKIAPAPLKRLHPVVHCPTQKYSSKLRLGKGFTLEELKAVKLHPRKALQIGISIDYRRRNRCEESLNVNVARLQEYLSKVVVVDKKKGVAAPAVTPTQGGTIQPIVAAAAPLEIQDVTEAMKSFKAYTTMRVVRQETRVDGYRIAVIKRKQKE